MHRLKTKFIFLIIILSQAINIAHADEHEVHVISYLSTVESKDKTSILNNIKVEINRDSKNTILFLGSGSSQNWQISHKDSTEVKQVILFGENSSYSKVYLNGNEFDDFIYEPSIRLPHNEQSIQTRTLVKFCKEKLDSNHINSLQIIKSHKNQLNIYKNEHLKKPWLGNNYLDKYISDTSVLPIKFIRTLEDFKENPDLYFQKKPINFSLEGFVLNLKGKENQSITIPISPEVPAISWPIGAIYNQENNALYGITLGGEGYIYKYDLIDKRWSILSSMNGFDAGGIYNDSNDLFLIGGGISRENLSSMLKYNIRTGKQKKYQFKIDDFTGYYDLFDPSNGPAYLFEILVVEKNELLVITKPGSFNNNIHINLAPDKWRLYMINLNSKKIHLVAYKN